MDLVTQGILGATFAQSFSKKSTVRVAAFAGFLGGLAADSDVFIKSSSDPLLALQFHRHFTHSLAFIPLGALIVAFIVWLILRRRQNFKTIYYFSFLGYATHGLLDACTSYGTRLLWPFNNVRIAWDNVAIIDPFFTLPLLIVMVLGIRSRNIRAVQIIQLACIAYLVFGVFQNHRAKNFIAEVAKSRGHQPTFIQAKPTFGQLVLWKTIYLADGIYYVDAVRLHTLPTTENKLFAGDSAPALDVEKQYSALDKDSVLYKDILRFRDFSSNMVILHPDYRNVIGDARYSLLPNNISPLWGITVDVEKPNSHAMFSTFRSIENRDWSKFWSMITGTYSAE